MTQLYKATLIKPFIGTSADIGRKINCHYNSIINKLSRGENEINGFKIVELSDNHTVTETIDISNLSLNQLEILKDNVYQAIRNFERVKDE